MPETMTGPEYDLLIVRTVRERILAGDWTQDFRGRDANGCCLVVHLDDLGEYWQHEGALVAAQGALEAQTGSHFLSVFNDSRTQAEVIALLDDVEDSLLGEMGEVS